MSRMWIILALLATIGTTPAQADLNLTNVRSTHGLLGPKRKDQPLSPGDLLVVRFDIEGITVDNDGKVKYSSALEVTDSNGKVVFKQTPVNSEQYLTLGGNRVPSHALLDVGLDTQPGSYRFKITVKDTASGKEQSLTHNLKVLPLDFALVRTTVALEPIPITARAYSSPVSGRGSVAPPSVSSATASACSPTSSLNSAC